jgi:hypothetical protein
MKRRTAAFCLVAFIVGITLFSIAGCKKDNSSPDFATSISGTYNGNFSISGVGSVTGSSKLTKADDNLVNLTMTISSQEISLDGIIVTSPVKNSYSLTYTDLSGSFTGTVQGNNFSFSMSAGTDVVTFTGTR